MSPADGLAASSEGDSLTLPQEALRTAPCSLADCETPARARGFCNTHYQKAWRSGSLEPTMCPDCGEPKRGPGVRCRHCRPPCGLEGCSTISVSRGLCHKHFNQAYRRGDFGRKPCLVPACGGNGIYTNLCQNHYQRRRAYGLTLEELLAVVANKDCDICGSLNHGGRGWHVDHDHLTGEPRGVLCHGCNVGLGSFGDDVETLRLALAYLEDPPLRRVAL